MAGNAPSLATHVSNLMSSVCVSSTWSQSILYFCRYDISERPTFLNLASNWNGACHVVHACTSWSPLGRCCTAWKPCHIPRHIGRRVHIILRVVLKPKFWNRVRAERGLVDFSQFCRAKMLTQKHHVNKLVLNKEARRDFPTKLSQIALMIRESKCAAHSKHLIERQIMNLVLSKDHFYVVQHQCRTIAGTAWRNGD